MIDFDDRDLAFDLADKDVTKNITKVTLFKTPILVVLVLGTILLIYMICTENIGDSKLSIKSEQYNISVSEYLYESALYELGKEAEIANIYQNIDDIYEKAYKQDLTNEMMIGLTYIEVDDYSNYRVSFKLNKKDISWGYFGPNRPDHSNEPYYDDYMYNKALAYTCKGYDDIAFTSTNKAEICKIVVEFKNSTKEIEIDSTTHFAQIIENGTKAKNITLYDINGDVVEYETVTSYF